ncbi:MAG: Fic family protein [Chitinophagaceae bacterium]|nr:Fic family protein [Chitinophagaceae bacterium]
MSYPNKRNQIDSLQQKINAEGELSADVKKKINYKFRLDWNYYSNSMEGNTLTMDETRSVMVGNLTVGGKPIKDVLEMKGHDEVITEIMRIGKGEVRLSEARIREIHKGIMHEEDEEKKKKIGVWKTEPNYIYNYKNERFDFVLPAEVPARIHDLLNKTNSDIDAIEQNKKDAPHPIDVALQFHLDYVIIHPFYDGNGRTARILTNLLLISFGYPPFWVKTNERNIYNQYIGDIQGYGGNPDLFFDFAADQILRSQNLVLDAITGKEISELDDLDKELALLRAELKGEHVLKTKANSENIAEAMEENIIPLFMMLEEKCEGLKEFFFDTGRRIGFEIEGESGQRIVGSKDSKWEHLKTNWLQNQIKAQGKKLRHIQYNYELKGFKKTVSANSFWLSVEVWFNDYNYTLQANPNRSYPIQVPYGEKFSAAELQGLVTPMLKEIIEGIKRLNGNVGK